MASSKTEEYRERLTNAIIDMLEKGTAPWQKPWDPRNSDRLPFNPTTGKPYHGINSLWLSMQTMAKGNSDPRWMTYKQAQEQGWQVRKGEKSTDVQYWKVFAQIAKTDASGRPVIGPDNKPERINVKLDHPSVFRACVFNAAQIDGIPPYVREAKVYEWNPIDKAEEILRNSGAVILHDQGDRAFYSRLKDEIHLPLKDQFRDAVAYYGTSLHELGHWTGHESRLNRKYGAIFGDEQYAREELRAEIASYFLAEQLGIPHDPGQHAAYVASWVKALREDKTEIFAAARDADAITRHLLELSDSRSKEKAAEIERDDDNTDIADEPTTVKTKGIEEERSALNQFIVRGQPNTELIHAHITADDVNEVITDRANDSVALNLALAEQFRHMEESALHTPGALNAPMNLSLRDITAAESFMNSVYGDRAGANLVHDLVKQLPSGPQRVNVMGVCEFSVQPQGGHHSYHLTPFPGKEHDLANMLRSAAEKAHMKGNDIARAGLLPQRDELQQERPRANDLGR